MLLRESSCWDANRRSRSRQTGFVVEALEDRVVLSHGATALAPDASAASLGATLARFVNPAPSTKTLVHLTLQPIDVSLLGLEVKSGPIAVTLTAKAGQGELLGNVLGSSAAADGRLSQLSNAANTVLNQTITLVNSGHLTVSGVSPSGPLASAPAATASVLQLTVAPIHVDALGVELDVSPFQLTVTAHAGQGLPLGNALVEMSNLFNPPLPSQLQLDNVNANLQQLLGQLNTQTAGNASATLAPSQASGQPVLNASLPGLNLNLLGLTLQTTPVRIDAASQLGNGQFLGNVLTAAQNAAGTTPRQLSALYGTVNAILAKTVGVLNASTLQLAPNALNSLPLGLRLLTAQNLFSRTQVATTPILDLGGNAAPAGINLLGLQIANTGLEAKLSAQTGKGQVLGNLIYNLSALGGAQGFGGLIGLLSGLASSTGSNPAPTQLFAITLNPLDLNLLGFEVQSSAITVTLSAQSGQGEVLGNVLASVSQMVQKSAALNQFKVAMSGAANLVNSGSLSVGGVSTGAFSTGPVESIAVASLTVPAVHEDFLGARVDVSPVQLSFVAHGGPGLVLGNALVAVANAFNPPLPSQVVLDPINAVVQQVLTDLNAQIPGIQPAAVASPNNAGPLVAAGLPGINLNLLGLVVQTAPFSVDAAGQAGAGQFLGNVLTTLTNSLGTTPQQLATLYGNVNSVLAKVVGVINTATFTLSPNALNTLPPNLRGLTTFTASTPGATIPILDLQSGSTPTTGLLGQQITATGTDLKLTAQTGPGLVLGNLFYNLVNSV
jgi:hypothetical protein